MQKMHCINTLQKQRCSEINTMLA